jgi:predicted transcriptional regulator
MPIGELCNRDVVVATADANLLVAARLMRSHHVGDIVVVEERDGRKFPTGILTDRDIVIELVAEEIDPVSVSISVGDVMSSRLFTLDENTDLLDAVTQMRGEGVRRLPVVDAAGALVGMLTLDDALEVLADALSDLVTLTRQEQHRERRTRD